MTLSKTVIERDNVVKLTTRKTNWDIFRQIIDSKVNLQVPIKTPQQLEDEAESLIKNIQQAAWDSTPSS